MTEQKLNDHQEAVCNLRQRLADLRDDYVVQRRGLERQLAQRRLELRRRQRLEKATTRARQRVDRLRQEVATRTERLRRRQRSLMGQLHSHEVESDVLREQLARRVAGRDAIDTETLCRERDLEKDQIVMRLLRYWSNLMLVYKICGDLTFPAPGVEFLYPRRRT